MGLFKNLFGKKEPELPPENPLEYYLEQRSADTLLKAAEKTLGVYVFVSRYIDKYKSEGLPSTPVGLTLGIDTIFIKEDIHTLDENGTEQIPEWYYTNKSGFALTCEAVLKTAAQKGSGLAAFYLAMLYQFGVCGEDSLAFADDYFALAETAAEPVKGLVDLFETTKNNNIYFMRHWTTDEDETLLMNLWMLNLDGWLDSEERSEHRKIVESLNDRERKAFLFITSFLVWAFASRGGVWATGQLSSIISNYSESVDKGQFYGFTIRFADNTFWGHENPEFKQLCFAIRYELWLKGENGNEFAKNYCLENFDVGAIKYLKENGFFD